MPPYPINYTKEFKVPEWLNRDKNGAERDFDDEELAEESGYYVPIEESKVGTRYWST
jgi:hypothetical protein